MGIKKKKISEMPLAESLDGLFTLGVNKVNRSVKVGLEFVETAAVRAEKAAASVGEATQAAQVATGIATQAAASASTAASTASRAAVDARSAANLVQVVKPGSVAVDQIRGRDAKIENGFYSMLSLNRPRNFLCYVAESINPLLPIFECKYKGQKGNTQAQITSVVSATGYTNCDVFVSIDTLSGSLLAPIRAEVSEIVVPEAVSGVRKIYIRELHNDAKVTITELDANKNPIATTVDKQSTRSKYWPLLPATRFVTLKLEYGLMQICTRLSVYCTHIGAEPFFNNPVPDWTNRTQGVLLCFDGEKYDRIVLPDSVRYVHEKRALRVFDRKEQRFAAEAVDVRDYAEVLFGKQVGADPYEAILLKGGAPLCGRVGVFVHRKWRQRIFGFHTGKGVPGGARHRSKYALARRKKDQLPAAADVYLLRRRMSVAGDRNLHRYFTSGVRVGDVKYRSMRYLSCFVSVYKTPSPTYDKQDRSQPRQPIGTRIYFRLFNRTEVGQFTNLKRRVWVVEA